MVSFHFFHLFLLFILMISFYLIFLLLILFQLFWNVRQIVYSVFLYLASSLKLAFALAVP